MRKARDHVLVSRVAIKTTMGTFMERGRAGRELDLLMPHATGVSKATNVARYAKILLEADVPILLIGWHRDVDDIWCKELANINRPSILEVRVTARKTKQFNGFSKETPM